MDKLECECCLGKGKVGCNHCYNGTVRCPICGGSGLITSASDYCPEKNRRCKWIDRPEGGTCLHGDYLL